MMAVTPFLMVLIGCASGGQSCEAIATLPVAYRSQATCLAARASIITASGDLGYARVVAECRPAGATSGKVPVKAGRVA